MMGGCPHRHTEMRLGILLMLLNLTHEMWNGGSWVSISEGGNVIRGQNTIDIIIRATSKAYLEHWCWQTGNGNPGVEAHAFSGYLHYCRETGGGYRMPELLPFISELMAALEQYDSETDEGADSPMKD